MNLARLFVEKRHVAWVALVAVLVWGVWAYLRLPQRKDPEVVIKTAVVTTAWPGAGPGDVEELVTRPVELAARQVPRVDTVTSTTRAGISTVFVTLEDSVRRADLDAAWNDLQMRLDALGGRLPAGALAPRLDTRFGDTAAVVYSLASPPAADVEIALRARAVRAAVERHRAQARPEGPRAITLFLPAPGISREQAEHAAERYLRLGERRGALAGGTALGGAGFVAVEHADTGDEGFAALARAFEAEALGGEHPHPDVRGPLLLRDLAELEARIAAVAADRYSDRQLDEYSDLLADELARLPEVSRVDRHGVVPERVELFYSQERLASLGIPPARVGEALHAANVTLAGGSVGTGRQSVLVDPSGSLASLEDLLGTVVATTSDGRPVQVRDVVEVHRTYEWPAPGSSWLAWRDERGWHSTRSVALAVQLRSGVQTVDAGARLDAALERAKERLPADLRIVKTSDQPELVRHKIRELMRSLLEAVAIVVAVALLFMERRSALLVAASIPLTLAMTFGFMQLLGLDLQQVSIAALIIALGLLVDDPVIAGDAINRELAAGVPRRRAAWQGPVKLARAILYATVTNIVAFAPLLLVDGTMGEFIYAMPMVVTLSLVSSRIVSMTFMPLLGYHLLRGQKGLESALEGTGRSARLARGYNAVSEWMLDHKKKSAAVLLAFLALGLAPAALVRTQFFPEEAMSRFYIHVRLPEGADARATHQAAARARELLLETEGERLQHVTAFVGAGGPRWWSNVAPEPRNPAYALLVVHARDAEETMPMIGRLQRLLNSSVAGARFEVWRLSSGKPAVTPVEVRLSGPDVAELRRLGAQVGAALRAAPQTADLTDDWGPDAPRLVVRSEPARAAAAGVTRADLASSAQLALAGRTVTRLRDGERLVDVVLRLAPAQRPEASSVRDLYVWSGRSGRAIPVEQVADVRTAFEPPKIVRRNLERTLTIGAIPRDGELASELLASARPALDALELPAGYRLEHGGEQEMQAKSFQAVRAALAVSVALIFLALVWQFGHFFKPLVVFAAIPFGLVGAVLGLVLTGTNFGFMAFLGVASLVGVIVSHIIVLFDFIEEARERGVGLHRAVIDAGLVRLRPVLVTVLATVGGLVPLGLEGGPMWRQLVYVQIAGLLLATLVTKGVVPLLYVVFVETLKVIRWEAREDADEPAPERPAGVAPPALQGGADA